MKPDLWITYNHTSTSETRLTLEALPHFNFSKVRNIAILNES